MTNTLILAQNALNSGGPALWAIAGLSVITLAVITWKVWRLLMSGVWSRSRAEAGVAAVLTGRESGLDVYARNIHQRFVAGAAFALRLPAPLGAEEVTRLAQRELGQLRTGLRPLELIVTIAPLIGLLGTVLGMIAAFQALETSGGQADPAILAGGIWEALLTTAAGMAVAIPAAVALSWFEGITETVQAQMEDAATRMFIGTHS